MASDNSESSDHSKQVTTVTANKLSPDVLLLIFKYAIAPTPETAWGHDKSHATLRRISHVCRSWRETALLCGPLWAIALEHAMYTHPKWFETIRHRTNSVPLRFTAPFAQTQYLDLIPRGVTPHVKYFNTLTLLSSDLARIKHLDLHLAFTQDHMGDDSVLRCLSDPADKLETLSIQWKDRWMPLMFPVLGSSPMLRKVTLVNVIIPGLWSPSPVLSELSLSGLLQPFKLPAIPSLRTLTLEEVDDSGVPGYDSKLPSLRELRLRNMTLPQDWTLIPSLTKFKLAHVQVSGPWGDSFTLQELDMFDVTLPLGWQIGAPCLRTLCLESCRPLDRLSPSPSPYLEKLTMSNMVYPESWGQFPSLRNLVLMNVEFKDGWYTSIFEANLTQLNITQPCGCYPPRALRADPEMLRVLANLHELRELTLLGLFDPKIILDEDAAENINFPDLSSLKIDFAVNEQATFLVHIHFPFSAKVDFKVQFPYELGIEALLHKLQICG